MSALIREFLSYLEAEQRASSNTVEAYGRDLRQFIEWFSSGSLQNEDSILKSVSTADVRGWAGSLADSGMTAATLRRKIQSLRAFFRWGMRRGKLTSNPAIDLVLAKKRKHLPNFIKETEMEDLLDRNHDGFAEERIHIALTLLYSLGLRQAELLALTDNDIDFTALEIRVTGKRNKQRVLPIPGSLAEEIARWQDIRDTRYPDLPRPATVISGPHGRLSKSAFYSIIRDALAGVSAGRKSPHTLRHSFATAMVNNGADLDAVREMLGHESLSTTQIYTHLSFNELLADYRHAHPRSAHKDPTKEDKNH